MPNKVDIENRIDHADVLARSFFNKEQIKSIDKFIAESKAYRTQRGTPSTQLEEAMEMKVLQRLLPSTDFVVGLSYKTILVNMLTSGSDGVDQPEFSPFANRW